MIGSGIFLLPAALAFYGGISILGWIISGAGAIALAVVFSRLSRKYPITGGPYAYTREGYGDFAGFLVAWGYWISIWCTNAAIAIAFVSYFSVFVPGVSQSGVVAAASAILVVWLLTFINARGVQAGSKVQVVTVVLKVIPLVLVSVVGLFFIDTQNFVPFNRSEQSGLSALNATVTLTLFAFLGIESATIPSHEVRNPKKNIPRATMLGTIITLLVYIAGSTVVLGIIAPGELAVSEAPFADAAARIAGPSGSYVLAFGALASTFGALNGWILLQGQVPYAIGRDRLFPPFFSRTNKSGAPTNGLVVGSVLVSFLIISNYTRGLVGLFTFAILLATLTVLVPYLFCSFAEVVIMIRKGVATTRTFVRAFLIGIPAFVFSVYAVIGSGAEIVFYGFILLVMGIPFYVLTKWKSREGDRKN